MCLVARLIACIYFAALTAACNPLDRSYFREGVGTDLYWAGLPEAARLENLYIAHLCQQAGLHVAVEGSQALCSLVGRDWETFVQAGMNDIDHRCDAYLAWLDHRKRSSGPILQQISDMRTATIAIMSATGVGVTPIAVAAAAFGLASSTFSNLNSRLLMEIDNSTVQAIVLRRQREYREGLISRRIDNRPAALHALRSYLRLCMPYTIEMEINTTIATFERGGARALEARKPLIATTTVGVAGSGARVTVPTGQVYRGPSSPVASYPPSGGGSGTATVRPEAAEPAPAYARFIAGYDPRRHPPSYVQRVLGALCLTRAEASAAGAKTAALIGIFEATDPADEDDPSPTRDGRLDEQERNRLLRSGSCRSDHRNFFEKQSFPRGTVSASFANRLYTALSASEKATGPVALDTLRRAIAEFRQKFGGKLEFKSDAVFDHITPDLDSRI
jgi:hypothetical protein